MVELKRRCTRHDFPRGLLLGCALGWAAILVVGQSWNFIYADDSLPFVVRVFQGQPHPHHLILGLLSWVNAVLGWKEPQQFGWTLGLVRAYVALMSVFGLSGIGYLAWLWFRRRGAVGVAMLVAGGSYGYWAYSVVPDMYVPGIAAVIGAAIALERFQETAQRRWLAGVVGCSWLAAMNHQSYAVFAVIAILLLLHARKRQEALSITSSLALIGAAYLLAFAFQREYQGFWHFVLGYASHMQFLPYDRLQLLTPLYALVGVVRAWTFPEYFLRLDTLASWVEERWRMKLFLDERFLLRGIEPSWAMMLGSIGLVAACFLLGLGIWAGWQCMRRLREQWGFWAILWWGCLMGILAVLWEPSSSEFWLWMPPVWALFLAGAEARWQRWTVAGAGGLVLLTTAPVIWLYRSPENDIYSVNKRYRMRLTVEDVLLTADFQQLRALNWLYPTRARTLEFELGRLEWREPRLQQMLQELARPEARGRLIFDPLLVMPHPSESALRMKIPRYTEAYVEGVLQQIAAFCQGEGGAQPRRRIPLFGIWRDGGGVVRFQVRQLPGMEWLR